jgi:regulator of ribosome biosynthesis
MTRWDKFAKVKGIQKRKKERMVFDEAIDEYVPVWGYGGEKRRNDMEDWLIPVKNSLKPEDDPYTRKREEKRERIAKNERRRQRNSDEAAAIAPTRPSSNDLKKRQLQDRLVISKTATASIGKHDKKLGGEPKLKGVKRKFEPSVADLAKEKQSSLNILSKIGRGADTVNTSKAIRMSNRR